MRVVMLHTPDFLPSDISVPVAQAYCRRWGYPFDHYYALIRPEWVPAWNKVLAVQSAMRIANESEWIAWIDADVLILRQDFALESFLVEGKDLLFSTDHKGLCTGFFLIRKCATMQRFLQHLCSNYCTTWPWEQTAAKNIIAAAPHHQRTIAYISSSIIQNPRSIFHADAFAMHYWANGRSYLKTKESMLLALQHGWKKGFLDISSGSVAWDLEFARYEIEHREQIFRGSIASRFSLGG